MNLVVDANILFAALIKEGKTVEILADYQHRFYAPEYLFEEFLKYKDEVIKKTHRSEDDFGDILTFLKSVITLIPNDKTGLFIDSAKQLSPDENDIDYFAVALKLNCSIWSNDKKLKEQTRLKVYSTDDLLKF